MSDTRQLAQELAAAHAARRIVPSPTSRDASFDLAAGYAVERELARLRRDEGRTPVGWKIGYPNRAVWRALKLETVVWGHMYDDTVHFASGGELALSIARMIAPKIEPEIVFKVKLPLTLGDNVADAAAALEATEWIAFGYEIIDCAYPDWKFQPPDFVADYGLHAASVIGAPVPVRAAKIPELVEQLAQFEITLKKNGAPVAQGGGRNVMRSPALAVAELASAMPRRPEGESLAAGAVVTTGSLTDSQFISAGETWQVEITGLGLEPLTLKIDV